MKDFAELRPRAGERAQLTITVPPHLARHVEALAAEYDMTKSAVVADILEHDRRKREEALLREGYLEMDA